LLGQPINPAMKDFHVNLFLEVDYMKDIKKEKEGGANICYRN